MIKTFKNANKFVRDVIHPYVVNLNMVLKEELNYIVTKINELNATLTSNIVGFNSRLYFLENDLRTSISNALLTLSNQINTLATTIDTHTQRKDNPHVVKAAQTATVSALAPISAQGTPGDTWIQYHN